MVVHKPMGDVKVGLHLAVNELSYVRQSLLKICIVLTSGVIVKSDKNSCVKTEKREQRKMFKPHLLFHLQGSLIVISEGKSFLW